MNMSKSFDDLLKQVADCPKKTVAVACAHDDAVLEAVKAAKERGIADAILVGDESKIRTIAQVLKMHLNDYKITFKGFCTVYAGLSFAQQVDIWPVYDLYSHLFL